MPLAPGARLGPYEILSRIGSGGMGEVFKARDTRLDRTVAIKVCSGQFNERFEREARAVAALNHPCICTLHDVGSDYLVMELVEGPTLAERIARGPLPLEEALAIATHLAEALEYSHEKGLIHRDLKPANIKITPAGSVKVLDFGLAKWTAGERSMESVDPTLTATATERGAILGTAAYMAPEQARGEALDKRADIWAFGVVVYEMVTGRRLFQRDTFSDTLMAVLNTEPDWTPVPAKVLPLLQACLEKNPKLRLRDIGDAWRLLKAPESTPRRAFSIGPWAVAFAFAVALAVVALLHRSQAPSPTVPLRLNLATGPDVILADNSWGGGSFAISPDGRRVVFRVRGIDSKVRLGIRRLDEGEGMTAVSGTEAASGPFFSPDGQWIGFFAGGKLKKIAVEGGVPVTLCDGPANVGASWGDDGNIVATLGVGLAGLSRIPAAGGTPTPVTVLDPAKGELRHSWPQVLPGAQAVLFSSYNLGAGMQAPNIEVLSLKTGARKILGPGFFARYLPSGHLVYVYQNTLFAAPFDLGRLELAGPPRAVLADISPARTALHAIDMGGEFDVSQNGTLICLGGNVEPQGAIYWLDNKSQLQPLHTAPGVYAYPRFSPDGKSLAFTVEDAQGHEDIWVQDLERDTTERLTYLPGANEAPVWTPDGRNIVFLSQNPTAPGLYSIRADRSGKPQLLTKIQVRMVPHSISLDGKWLTGWQPLPKGGFEIWTAPIEGSVDHLQLGRPATRPPPPVVTLERDPVFSPDGHWLAYGSDDSGPDEVYVRPFPGPGGGKLISAGGGTFPLWSRNGRQIFFIGADGRLMAVDFTAKGDSFAAGRPRVFSEQHFLSTSPPTPTYDLTPDGKRFAVVLYADKTAEAKPIRNVTLLLNFFDDLRRRVPPGDR